MLFSFYQDKLVWGVRGCILSFYILYCRRSCRYVSLVVLLDSQIPFLTIDKQMNDCLYSLHIQIIFSCTCCPLQLSEYILYIGRLCHVDCNTIFYIYLVCLVFAMMLTYSTHENSMKHRIACVVACYDNLLID